jgi:very-short-patch-repair endonuclease
MGDKSRFSSPFKGRARELRRVQTLAEKHAWHVLLDRRTIGLKFRRQVPIDAFIVDFYCDELRLVIEIDGDVHDKTVSVQRDAKRDERLKELGYTVLRFPNAIVINDPDVLVESIRILRPSPGATARGLSRRPLPGGEVG